MKKMLCALAAFSLVVGCSDTDNSNDADNSLTQDKLVGTWVMKMEDGEETLTNGYFAMTFDADGTQDFMTRGDVAEDGTSTWLTKEGTSYTVKDNTIYLLSDDDDIQLYGSISSGSLCGEVGDILSYREVVNIDGGEDMYSDRSFAGIRSEVDYSSDIVGTWEGVIIDEDINEPFDNIKFVFTRTGTYDFYALNDEGEWEYIDTNEGLYFLMGNLLATQWTETTGLTYSEAWVVALDGDTMTWRAEREDNPTAGFDFVRITE